MNFSKIYIFVFIALWIFLSIRAFQLKNNLPWGFGIVILGVLISGYGFDINNNSAIFSINLLFVLMLIGVFWNINNIRQLIQVENRSDFLRYITVGIAIGLLLGGFLVLFQGVGYLQINSQYSLFSLISISIQISLAEEFLFRGFLLGYLKKFVFDAMSTNVIQAVLFAAIHISRYSGNWMAILLIFLAGFVAGYFTLRNKNLITAFFLHAVVNLVAVIWWLTFGL